MAIAIVLALGLVATPAGATTVTPTGTIKGRVESTWAKAGGARVLGDPIGKETKIQSAGRNTYHQHTTLGATVYWDGSQGGRVWKAGQVPALAKVDNERDALARSGLKAGVLYRTAKLCRSTSADDRLLNAMLHRGTIVDLRSTSTAKGCPDPSLVDVRRVRYSMTATADTAAFVTRASDRKAIAAALRVVANSSGPVLLHCTHGRDRTGWVVSVVLMLAGVDAGTVRAEYLRSPGVKASNLDRGVREMFDLYDGVEGYARDGLGLTQREIDAIVKRVA